jgi:steroid delta-isomerase-like uncharacterized protein
MSGKWGLNLEAGLATIKVVHSGGQAMMLLHQNRRLWQRHMLAENRRSIEGLLETLCDDPIYKVMATNETHQGKAAVADFYQSLFVGVPDAFFELINVFVGEEGVVEESILRGTHQGQFFGIEATWREIALPVIIVFPMLNGQIMGERLYFDAATLARQLGVSVDSMPRIPPASL